MQDAPLKGLKVIELARILAGPWAGQTLADLGAEVLKIESPQGDDTRSWGPPFLDHDGEKSQLIFMRVIAEKNRLLWILKMPKALTV